MIRTLLATTALAALLSTGAMAQDTAPAAPQTPAATETPAVPAAGAVESGAMEQTELHKPWDMSAGYVVADTDNLGSRLIGQPVYSSTGDDAEEIGKISDLVFAKDGQITAVIIGVGGFLGIGEKAVAVDFQSLEFTLAADNTERWVLPTTADALTAAPEFVWKEDKPVDAGAMPVTDPAAPAAPMAPAPAPATN